MASRKNRPAKGRIVEALPPLGNTEVGEIYIEITNNRIYVRTVAGWKYVALS